jgi:hypothetical protein
MPAFSLGCFASSRSCTGSIDSGSLTGIAGSAHDAEIVIKNQVGCEVFVSAEAEAVIAELVSVCFDDFLG